MNPFRIFTWLLEKLDEKLDEYIPIEPKPPMSADEAESLVKDEELPKEKL